MTRNRLAAAVVVAFAAFALVACSSTEDKNAYIDEVNTIQEDALRAVTLTTAAPPSNRDEMVSQLESATGALDDAVAQLNEVSVPEEAQVGHDDFVAAVQAMSDLFSQTAEKAAKADQADLLTIAAELQTQGTEIGTDIDAAITKINQDIGAE